MLSVYSVEAGLLHKVDCTPEHPALASATWIDLLDPSREEELAVERALGVDIPSREEMRSVEVSSAIYREAGASVMAARVISRDDAARLKLVDVKFILKDRVLTTLRYGDPRPFRTFVARAEREVARLASGEAVLVGLLETVIDRAAELQGEVGDELEALSTSIFAHDTGSTNARGSGDLSPVLARVGRNGDLVSRVRESLHTLARVVPFLRADGGARLDHDLTGRLETLARDLGSLIEHNGYLASQVTFLLDATLGFINIQQNGIIKVLSVASVVFLPPTFIASLYGMNFKDIPELQWAYGYPYALVLMAATAVLPYVYFKRRGWL